MNELEKLKRSSEKALDHISDQVNELLYALEDLSELYNGQDDELTGLRFELDMKNDEIESMEKELRFLGKFLSESGIDFPLEGHPLDFGEYLPLSDERRYSIETE